MLRQEEAVTDAATNSTSAKSDLSHMVEVIAKMLVDLPAEVSVAEVLGENTTVIELKVAKTDIGKIIGKEGKTAKAIRTILLGAATKLKRRTVLEIIE
jgi:predicted RNA-binding protein YlqC (UPF0109 family)